MSFKKIISQRAVQSINSNNNTNNNNTNNNNNNDTDKILIQQQQQQQKQQVINNTYEEFIQFIVNSNSQNEEQIIINPQFINIQLINQLKGPNQITCLYQNTFGTKQGQIYQICCQNIKLLYSLSNEEHISVKQITQNFFLLNNGYAYYKHNNDASKPIKLELKYEILWICQLTEYSLFLDSQNNIWIYKINFLNEEINISERNFVQRLEINIQDEFQVEKFYIIQNMLGLQLTNNSFILISLVDQKIVTKLYLDTKIRKILYLQQKIYILTQQITIFNVKILKLDYLNLGTYFTSDIALIKIQNQDNSYIQYHLLIASGIRLIAICEGRISFLEDLQFSIKNILDEKSSNQHENTQINSFTKPANPKILMISDGYIIWKSEADIFYTYFAAHYVQ